MTAGPSCHTAPRVRRVVISCIAILATGFGSASAESAGWDIDVGLAGAYRAGSWTPLRILPREMGGAAAGDLVCVWAQDPDGEFVRAPAAELRPTADGALEAVASVRIGRPTGRVVVGHLPRGGADTTPVTLDVTAGGQVEVTLPEPIPSTHRVLVVLGDLPAAGRAARLMTAPDTPPLSVVAPLGRGRIAAGDASLDYDMADMMLVCGRSVAEVPPEVLAGVDAWVRDGGRILFCAGESAVDVAGGGGPAASWLPGSVDRLVPLRRVTAVEAYARAGGLATRPGVTALRVPLLVDRKTLSGTVDVFEGTGPGDLPLVIRKAHGLGVVTWVGLDLDDGPLRSWTGTDALLVRLLGGRADDGDRAAVVREPGAADLAGQLRVALERGGGDRSPPVATVPFEAVVGIGLLYVLALYPLDWWIASRGRPGSAWLTLPAFVVLFSAVAWGLAERRRPEDRAAVLTAEVIDVDVAGERVQSHGWAAAWSGVNGAFDVGVGEDGADSGTVTWFADAGTGFGGIDAVVAHPMLAAAPYRHGRTLASLERVPVAAASNRLFEATWERSARGGGLVTSTLSRDGQGILRGRVAHHLPFELEDCRLAHGGWVYDIGSLSRDVTVDLRSSRGPRSLAGALQRRGAADDRDLPTRWNRGEPDVLRILEVAGLHGAAGGAAYTLMPGGRLAGLDRSALLGVDRALLVGTVGDVPPDWAIPWRVGAIATEGHAAAEARTVESIARLCTIVIPLGPVGEDP